MTALFSLLEEARLKFPGCSDVVCIERVAAQIIKDLDERPPVCLEVVASYRDISSVRVEPLPFAGSLTPESSGLVMRLNSHDGRARQRFSGFHEVGHTFQPGYLQQTLFRCNPEYSRRPRTLGPEQLADIAAAELLMPRRFFEADLASIEPDIDAVSELATIYEASLHATALRTVQLSTRPVLLVVLEPGVRKAERQQLGAMPRLRVTGSSSNGYFPFIPRNKSATEEGALVKALAGEDVETTASLLELGIPSDSFRVSARSVPYTDQRGECHQRVIAIFWQPSAA